MKRFLICLLCVCLMSSGAMAQRFSNSLGGSGTTATRSVGVKKVNSQYNRGTTARKTSRKTVLRYTQAQTGLNKEQEKQVARVLQRIQEGRTKSYEIVGIARDRNINFGRLNVLRQLFISYLGSQPSIRTISENSVFSFNDNTVEIYEYF